MKAIIDLEDCLTDSPRFRAVLHDHEGDIHTLEVKLEKIVKLCNDMIEASKVFVKSKGAFINGIFDLSTYFNQDPPVVKKLDEINRVLKKLLQYQSMLVDQMNRAVARNLNNFLKKDIHKVKETKKHFDKISEDYDNALVKNSTCLKSKPVECEEALNILKATRFCFQHTTLDYVCQISCLQAKKRYEVLDSLLLLIQAYGTYFFQGSDLIRDFDVKSIVVSIQEMKDSTKMLQRELEQNHSLVNKESPLVRFSKGEAIRSQGYLFKRTTNAFKTWNRRWFMIQNNRLVYQKKNEKDFTVMEEDLRLCNVKPIFDGERRFCFEIVSPSRYHMLQADSEEGFQHWISSLQAGIDAAYNGLSHEINDSSDSYDTCNTSRSSNSPRLASENTSQTNLCPPKPPRVMPIITGLPGNEVCADCKSSDTKWASINLGITLCIDCAGVHRGQGVQISKVKSLILDAWDSEQIKLMLSLGNNLINSILESNFDERKLARPKSSSTAPERELFIRAKYVNRQFVDKSVDHYPDSPESLKNIYEKIQDLSASQEGQEPDQLNELYQNYQSELLYSAAEKANLEFMCIALLKGASVDWVNINDDGMTALHKSVESHSVPCCEYLLLNGAKCNAQDNNGRSPLHLACEQSNTGIVCLLIKRGADLSLVNKKGLDSLSIAVTNTNADIVTLLRLAKLNEEMRNDEYSNTHEELFNEVVRDFSNKASKKQDPLLYYPP